MTAKILAAIGICTMAVYLAMAWLWWPLPLLVIGTGCALELFSLRASRRRRGPVRMVEFQLKGKR